MNRPPAARDPFADDPFLEALRNADALTPNTARSRSELPEVSDDLFSLFVSAGVIRDAGDGRYYLVRRSDPGGPDPARFTPMSVAIMTAVWAVAMLVPLIVWLIVR